jgi:uncharacterized protein (UPF0332 family)
MKGFNMCEECNETLESYQIVEKELELNKKGLDRTFYMRALSNIYEAYFEERFRPIKEQVEII